MEISEEHCFCHLCILVECYVCCIQYVLVKLAPKIAFISVFLHFWLQISNLTSAYLHNVVCTFLYYC